MKFYRNCLIIGLTCWLIAGLIGWYWLTSADADTAITINYQPSIGGFKSAIAIKAEPEYRLQNIAVGASGYLSNAKKYKATDGYKWGANVYGKWFPSDQLFVGTGYAWHGYKSKFSDHGAWEKKAGQPVFMTGIQNDYTEIRLTHWLRESDTPNRVNATGISVRQRITDPFLLSADMQYFRYTQDGKRESDISLTAGVGIWF